MGKAASGSLDPADPSTRELLFRDALITAGQALGIAALTDEDFESLQKIVEEEPLWPCMFDEAALRAGVPLSAGIIRAALAACFMHWEAQSKLILSGWQAVPNFDGSREDVVVLPAVHNLMRALVIFEDDGPFSLVCQSCLGLADALDSVGRLEDSLAAALTAGNFAQSPDMSLRTSDMAIRLAADVGNSDALSLALARRAHALSQMNDAENRLRAFDAVPSALRHLPSDAANRATALNLLSLAVAASPHLEVWRRIVHAIKQRARSGGSEPADTTTEQLDEGLQVFTSPDAQDWPVEILSALSVGVERAREALIPNVTEKAVITSWITGSFDHYAYRNAIPHHESLLRERDLDQILLIMGHELSHMLSMQGHIGVALSALRSAAVELELVLWTFADPQPQSLSLRDLIAPLGTTEVRAVARSEQALDVARKRQILQATWSPWFEGIGEFAELAVDPSADDFESDIGLLLLNSVDDSFVGEEAGNFVPWLAERRRVSEAMYANGQQMEGPHRLRNYLDGKHRKYLPGYLAVRSVVSSWRGRIKTSLSGSEAYRLLLHRTRYDTRRAIPDLSLPTVQFATESERLMLAWVRDVAATRGDDIEKFLTTDQPVVWRDNRLAEVSAEEAAAESDDGNDWYRDCVRSALRTNAGCADEVIGRIPGADEITRRLLSGFAESFGAKEIPLLIADELAAAIFAQRRVLPLGRVTAPFWLESGSGRLICAIRTMEHSRETDMSSYDLMGISLDRDRYDALAAEMDRRRESRMMIYRVVDLVPQFADRKRQLGRQVYAFKYGDWLQVENCGIYTGVEDVPEKLAADVQTRIAPSDLVDGEYKLAAFTTAAQRTVDWLTSRPAWIVDDPAWEPAVEALTNHVTALAQEVIGAAESDPHTEDRMSRRLLESVFGSGDLTDGLIDLGIYSIDDGDPQRRAQLIGALFRSGFYSSAEPWLDDDPGSAGLLFANIRGNWDVMPCKSS